MYKFTVSSYNCYEPAYRVMSIIDRTSEGLSAIIFIFLVIFSGKTQSASLVERFREIGILKSLGWSDSKLGLQILAISLIHAVTGVTAGVLAGIFIIPLMKISDMAISINFNQILLLYVLSVAGAIMAVAWPTLRIFRSNAGDIIKNYS